MASARDFIKLALKEIGVLADGETPSASAAADALTIFNDMLEGWSAENLFVFHNKRQEFDLVASQQAYTLGSGGDFDRVKPDHITRIGLIDTTHSPQLEIPIAILNDDEWARTVLKPLSSAYPMAAHIERDHPLKKLHFWPVPAAAYKVAIYLDEPILELDDLDDDIDLPRGYAKAIRLSLAEELAPSYGIEPSASIVSRAAKARSVIKRMNSKERLLRVDQAVTARQGLWDWRTGEYR